MKKFEVEYTTNLEDRKTIVIIATSYTDAYLKCVYAFPMHYIITEVRELRCEF